MVSPLRSRDSRITFQILDYLIVLRPTLLFPVWTLVLLGYYQGFSRLPDRADTAFFPLPIFDLGTVYLLLRPSSKLWGTMVLYSMLTSSVYIINQITDRQTDHANNKLYLVAQGHVRLPLLKIEIALLLASATIGTIVLFHNNLAYLLLIGLSVLLGVMYSVPPLRLKSRPILDLLANAIGYGGIAFLVGWATAVPIDADTLWQTIPYVLCVGAAFVNTTLPDLKGDETHGDQTTGVLLGVERSCQLSLILLVAAILSAVLLENLVALITGLFSLPFFVFMNFKREKSVIILATRTGILILTLLACLLIPYYFILFVGTLFFVRWYYSARFGIKYP